MKRLLIVTSVDEELRQAIPASDVGVGECTEVVDEAVRETIARVMLGEGDVVETRAAVDRDTLAGSEVVADMDKLRRLSETAGARIGITWLVIG